MMNLVNKQQKEILKKAVEYRGDPIPVMVFRNITGGDGQSANALIAAKYIDVFPAYVGGKPYMAYRATEKAFMAFEPLPKRFWYNVKGEIKTILVATITAVVITILTNQITNLLG